MEAPSSLQREVSKITACKFTKALYGFKQSLRAWFRRFTKAMISVEYKQCQWDPNIFIKQSSIAKLSIHSIYVEDIIVSVDEEAEDKQSLRRHLWTGAKTKKLWRFKYFSLELSVLILNMILWSPTKEWHWFPER
jgi:hypothetical protein